MFILILVGFSSLAQVEESINPEWNFKSVTRISQIRPIYVTDIADIRGFSIDELEKISKFPIPVNFVNEAATISSAELSRKIRGLVTELGSKIQIRIPSQVQIRILHQGVDETWIRKVLGAGIIENCPHCEYQLQRLSFSKSKIKRIKKYELQIARFRGGSFNWPIEIESEDSKEVINVSGFLKLYLMGPVAQRSLSPGDRIQAEDFRTERVNVTHRLSPLARVDQIRSAKLRRSVRPGQPIFQKDIAREKLITRGELVSVMMSRGLLKVQAAGQTLSSGDIGDAIRVRTNKTRRILTAIVREKGVVEVQ